MRHIIIADLYIMALVSSLIDVKFYLHNLLLHFFIQWYKTDLIMRYKKTLWNR